MSPMAAAPGESERSLIQAIGDYQAGRLDAAEAACTLLLRRDPRHPAVHQLLAAVFMQRGDVRAARQHIETYDW